MSRPGVRNYLIMPVTPLFVPLVDSCQKARVAHLLVWLAFGESARRRCRRLQAECPPLSIPLIIEKINGQHLGAWKAFRKN